MGISWETYKNVKYLYADYTTLSDLGVMELSLELVTLLEEAEENSLRLIIDATNVNLTFRNYFQIKDVAKKAQIKIYKSSFVGLNSYSKSLYNVYKAFTNSKAKFLDTLDEAKDYIVK